MGSRLTRAAAAFAGALALLVMGALPAHARAADPPSEFIYHWATGSNAIVVQASDQLSDRWGLPAVVRGWNEADTMNTHLGDCSDFPNQHCVKVVGYLSDDDGLGGHTTIVLDSEQATVVHLNRFIFPFYDEPQDVTCHEFGHVVGFTDDVTHDGCMTDEQPLPSDWELQRAANAYSAHRNLGDGGRAITGPIRYQLALR
jgi:hypothetical protein